MPVFYCNFFLAEISAACEMKPFIALAMVLVAVFRFFKEDLFLATREPQNPVTASAKKLIDEASGPCVLKDNLNAVKELLNYSDNSVRDGHISSCTLTCNV